MLTSGTRTRGRLVSLMQPVVTFLREAWKKWEQKRSGKRNVPASSFNYVPAPRRSRAWSHQYAGNTFGRTALPTDQISFEDYSKSALMSHKWLSIKRCKSSSTVKGRTSCRGEQVTSFCRNARRESHPVSPFTIPPGSKYPSHREQGDRVSDVHLRCGRNSSARPELPSLQLPTIEKNYRRDEVPNSSGFMLVRSSLSSPNIPCPSVVERPPTDPGVIGRGQTARTTSGRTQLLPPFVELPETPRARHPTDRVHPKTKSPPPDILICSAQSSNFHDFPLSLFPQPPPLPAHKKVPKSLVLRPSSSSSHSSLPYSPMPIAHRPRSLRSVSQTSISSSTKRALGRPLTSVLPPPTSPPNSPLPTPPVDKRMDLNFLSPSARSTSARESIRSCQTPTQQVYRTSAEYSS